MNAPTALFNVSNFKRKYEELLKDVKDETLEETKVDIRFLDQNENLLNRFSTKDIQKITKFDEVEEKIRRVLVMS